MMEEVERESKEIQKDMLYIYNITLQLNIRQHLCFYLFILLFLMYEIYELYCFF